MAVLLYSPIISIITLFLGGYFITRDKILERKLIMDKLVEALKKKFVINASLKSGARASLKYKWKLYHLLSVKMKCLFHQGLIN